MSSKNVLGRGVAALLPDDLSLDEESKFFFCDIDKIEANPHQPRSNFNEEKLKQLAESIRERGIIQPLLVSSNGGNRYQLIAGERRLRAARLIGEEEVPVVIMDTSGDDETLELALIENIQRQDLNPIEEAIAYARLIEEFRLTQEEVARKVGRKRSTVTNTLRLLKLPSSMQNDVASALISEGHARVLLRLKDDPLHMQEIRDRILKEDLSVRQTENLCRQAVQKKKPAVKKEKTQDGLPVAYCRSLSTQLTNHFHTKVKIIQNGTRGKLEIEYYSPDDLDRLISLVSDRKIEK
ncbi:chromosome partitioning protein, ParB family [Candidatus Electrothrix aarhusensis]|jgi:ParB family chromosome partitioning protein|uniref:Chromosome partitioning protein, ParB family n=1 Tax=Candidatus Electrothrix aarhusensis TaxID=1859131 RepID=A0A3S3QP35_9BACT|nr:chromosome partitioning protein, ParB family [Candidatus Electrothrix aarhusensis]